MRPCFTHKRIQRHLRKPYHAESAVVVFLKNLEKLLTPPPPPFRTFWLLAFYSNFVATKIDKIRRRSVETISNYSLKLRQLNLSFVFLAVQESEESAIGDLVTD